MYPTPETSHEYSIHFVCPSCLFRIGTFTICSAILARIAGKYCRCCPHFPGGARRIRCFVLFSQIALIRQGGEMAGGANGTTYNSRTTEITAVNIEKYFRHSIVDPSGNAASKFQALIQFLQNKLAA